MNATLAVDAKPSIARSIWAVVALALSYRIVITVLGGWVTARLAPRNAMKHVWILGSIGFVVGVAAAIATIPLNWGPAWYPILIPITGLPATILGGWLHARRATP